MIYSVKGLALTALAMGVGYLVLVAASKEKGTLKTLGLLLGALIIAACVAGAIMRVCSAGGAACPIAKCFKMM